jgi:hypothetical protein
MSGAPRQSDRSADPPPVADDDLVLDMEGLDFDQLLADWRWLVDEAYEPVLLTVLGDLFLQAPDGSIYWLEASAGRFSRVADSRAGFRQLLRRSDKVDEWFDPDLVSALQHRFPDLGPGQCYGYLIPPVVGGRQMPVNMEPTDLYVHFSILGQVSSQVRDVPPDSSPRSSVETAEAE